MAGDIFVGFDKNCPPGKSAYNDGYVNSDVFEAFRMAMEAALSKDFAPALDIILEGQYMNIISFIDLDSEAFNAVINTLRSYFSIDVDQPSFFVHAKWAWDNVIEPFLSKDERYWSVGGHGCLPGMS